MPLIHDIGDISVYTLGGIDLLGVFESVTYSVEETQQEGSIMSRDGETPQGTKLAGRLDTGLMSTISAPDRVSHLDLSGFTVGGTDYLAVLRSLKFSGSFQQRLRAGVGAWWKRPQNSKKAYKASVSLDCDDSVLSALMIAMSSTTYADRNKTLSFVLNGVTITLPTRMSRVEHTGQRDDLQMVTVDLVGRSPDSGSYPAAPTGTSTLLEKAFNAFQTELAFTFTSKAASGHSVTGNCIFNSFEFSVEDEQLVLNRYVFDTFGAPTSSATP